MYIHIYFALLLAFSSKNVYLNNIESIGLSPLWLDKIKYYFLIKWNIFILYRCVCYVCVKFFFFLNFSIFSEYEYVQTYIIYCSLSIHIFLVRKCYVKLKNYLAIVQGVWHLVSFTNIYTTSTCNVMFVLESF